MFTFFFFDKGHFEIQSVLDAIVEKIYSLYIKCTSLVSQIDGVPDVPSTDS